MHCHKISAVQCGGIFIGIKILHALSQDLYSWAVYNSNIPPRLLIIYYDFCLGLGLQLLGFGPD